MPKKFLPRLILLISGLVLLAFGVALSIRSNLGTSPISSLPYVYSFIWPLSIGMITILMHVVMITLQMLLLGKTFKWQRWLQLPIGVVFGFAIDGMMWLTQAWQPDSYWLQAIFCILSCLITAIGVCMVVKANLVFLAAEGLYQAISQRFKFEFASCKLYGDITLVSLALISSLLCLQQVIGIREGTILTAILVGVLVRKILPRLAFLKLD